jgi:TolA-binding protein
MALLALPPLLAGCVSSARHDAVVAERDRLRRENEMLRREAAEDRVRIEEALEALREQRGARRSSPAPGTPAPPSEARTSPGPASAAPVPPREPDSGAILEQDLRDAAPPDPEPSADEEGTLRAARRYTEMGRTEQAMDAFTRLIKDYPFSARLPEAFLARGKLRQVHGDDRGALADFETVVEAFPRSPQAAEARQLAAALRNR